MRLPDRVELEEYREFSYGFLRLIAIAFVSSYALHSLRVFIPQFSIGVELGDYPDSLDVPFGIVVTIIYILYQYSKGEIAPPSAPSFFD